MNHIVNILRSAEIFFQFTPSQLEMVSGICKEKSYIAGEIVFEENSKSKDLYVIASGEVEIIINAAENQNHTQVITTLGKGQSFGEIALVDEGHRSASVRVRDGNLKLVEISRDKLLMLCETYPHIGFKLMSNLAANLAMMVRNADRAAMTRHTASANKQLSHSPILKIQSIPGNKKRTDVTVQITNYDQRLKLALSKIVNDITVPPDN